MLDVAPLGLLGCMRSLMATEMPALRASGAGDDAGRSLAPARGISLGRQDGDGAARVFGLLDLRKGRRVKKSDRPGQTRMARASNEKCVAIG